MTAASPSLLRNTGWNLMGMTLPILAALVAIPPLIKGLGVERFGVLSIGWVVMGYFALFDLGLGRATTKFAAEHLSDGDHTRLKRVIWTSLHLHTLLGLAGGAIFALLTPWLAGAGFNIPSELRSDARGAFFWLAASIPFVVSAACFRGVLEALGRFGTINRVRIAGSLLNYVAPLGVLYFSGGLANMVAAIAIARVAVLIALARPCFAAISLRPMRAMTRDAVRPLMTFGGWVLVSSLVVPIIMVADRLFVAALLSVGAVTFYVTPYEVVTKLWILSASLMGALFPVLVSLAKANIDELRAIGERSERYLMAATAPLVGTILVLGRDFLFLWLGADFAYHSTAVAKWLAFGLAVHVVAQVPITSVQAAGRPDLIAKLQLAQLVPFVALAWVLLHRFGSAGVAMAWAARVLVEGAVSWYIASRLFGGKFATASWLGRWFVVWLFLAACWVIDSTFRLQTAAKLVAFAPLLTVFLIWQWLALLTPGERAYVRTRLMGRRAKA